MEGSLESFKDIRSTQSRLVDEICVMVSFYLYNGLQRSYVFVTVSLFDCLNITFLFSPKNRTMKKMALMLL